MVAGALTTTNLQIGFGSGILFVTRKDIANAPPFQLAALQDITISFTGELKDLFSQGQFPIAVARGKTKIEGKGKYALVSTPIYNSLFFGQTVTAGQTLTSFAEPHVAAASVVVTNGATFLEDLGVFEPATGIRFQPVTVAPTVTGTYQVTVGTGTYAFLATDAGKNLQISYTYTTPTGGYTLLGSNPLMGVTPVFSAHFNQVFQGNSLDLTLYNCVSTTLTLPTGGVDNFLISDFAFGAFADAGGNTFKLSTNQ
jgi:hypothetical protein